MPPKKRKRQKQQQQPVQRPPRTLVATNHLYLLGLVAVATALMLQAMRVFTSYMVFVIDQSNRAEIAAVVFPTFGAVAIGGLLLRGVGFRRTLLLGAFLFGATRLGFQFWDLPEARLALGAIALAAWGWLMLAVFRHWRESAAIGVGFGIALDLIIRIAVATRDLPWNPGPGAHLASVVLVVALMVCVAGIRNLHVEELPEYSTRSPWSLLAFGPGLALYHIATGNLGMAQHATGLSFPEAAILLALGTALGLRFALVVGELFTPPPGSRFNTGSLFLVIVLAIGLFLIGQTGVIAVPGVIVASAAGLVLLTFTVAGRPARDDEQPAVAQLTIAFTVGLLLQVGLLFLYYMFSGAPTLLGIIAGTFALLAIPAGIPDVSRPIHQPRAVLIGAGATAGILALVSGWHLLTWSPVEAGQPAGDEFTVITYNIQTGFDLENRWDLEATARTIEQEDPDVVVIQEITRGWLVTSSVDQVTWLSQRVDMPYVYGTSADDGLWGNAIFSRLPISEFSTMQYSETDNLKRGAVEVAVETAAGPVWIYGTHFDNPSTAGEVRLSQARELVDFQDGKQSALILGDFNTEPGESLFDIFTDAGFRDLGADFPDDAITSPSNRRIDFILGTEDIEVVDIRIPQTWTSDHLPVVATVRVAD